MGLTIHQVGTQLGIKTHWADLRLALKTDPLALQINSSRFTVKTRAAETSLDHERAKAGQGWYPWMTLLNRMAQRSKQKVITAIAQIARQGDELARIEAQIPDLIVRQGLEYLDGEVVLEFLENPPAIPEMVFTPGQLAVDFAAGQIEVLTARNEIRNYTPTGKVEIYIEQKPQLDIRG